MIIQGSLAEYIYVAKRSKFRFHSLIGLTQCFWFWGTEGEKRKLFGQYSFIFSNDYVFLLKSFIYVRSFYSDKKQLDVVQNSQWQQRHNHSLTDTDGKSCSIFS